MYAGEALRSEGWTLENREASSEYKSEGPAMTFDPKAGRFKFKIWSHTNLAVLIPALPIPPYTNILRSISALFLIINQLFYVK